MSFAKHLLLAVTVLAAGCTKSVPLGQVEGTVRAGRQPLAKVVVTFVPDSEKAGIALRSLATTDEQGRYRLSTEQQQDGAAIGKHRVIVEDLSILSAPRSADGTVLQRPPVRFSPAHSNLLKTPLRLEVRPGAQTLDLDLKMSP